MKASSRSHHQGYGNLGPASGGYLPPMSTAERRSGKRTYPLPGTTHDPWHLPRKSTGQYPHCSREQGKRARCLVQTHDGRLASVTVPSAWAGHRREGGGGLAQGTGNW
ncbi:hypothetical protein GBF38_013958 [Nibea albiflora]|uniref:Uncharacterized protein n=1 Tax=Nibea albiflora TaxID=240163 RepID=A0ACB7FA21_NIBAL|nr:hypothetical protein GBF38_013958 [Nibea albiflora]